MHHAAKVHGAIIVFPPRNRARLGDDRKYQQNFNTHESYMNRLFLVRTSQTALQRRAHLNILTFFSLSRDVEVGTLSGDYLFGMKSRAGCTVPSRERNSRTIFSSPSKVDDCVTSISHFTTARRKRPWRLWRERPKNTVVSLVSSHELSSVPSY